MLARRLVGSDWVQYGLHGCGTSLLYRLLGWRLGLINPALDRIGQGAQHGTAFHDITAGIPTSGHHRLPDGPGCDPVTGWGSPDVAVLIPLLAHQS